MRLFYEICLGESSLRVDVDLQAQASEGRMKIKGRPRFPRLGWLLVSLSFSAGRNTAGAQGTPRRELMFRKLVAGKQIDLARVSDRRWFFHFSLFFFPFFFFPAELAMDRLRTNGTALFSSVVTFVFFSSPPKFPRLRVFRPKHVFRKRTRAFWKRGKNTSQ